MELTKKNEKRCAYPGCTVTVTDDDHCAGCEYYICEAHCPNNPWGHHDVVEHWEENDE